MADSKDLTEVASPELIAVRLAYGLGGATAVLLQAEKIREAGLLDAKHHPELAEQARVLAEIAWTFRRKLLGEE